MHARPATASYTLLAVLLAVTGCEDLERYRAEGDKVYRGRVIGTEPASRSFIRRGFPAGTEMELTFDPTEAAADPGEMTTDDEICGEPTFAGTPLLPIAPLAHDELSQYEFPGGGRIRNYIFLAQPREGPLEDREPMIFVSLLRDGSIQLRVIAGPGRECEPSDCDAFAAGECDFFGVFDMTKQQR